MIFWAILGKRKESSSKQFLIKFNKSRPSAKKNFKPRETPSKKKSKTGNNEKRLKIGKELKKNLKERPKRKKLL